MSLTNTPTNALQTIRTPHQAMLQTTIQTRQTPTQTPYTQTPHTPQAFVARATGLGRPCSATRLRKGLERPRHARMHVDIQQHRSRSIPRSWQPGLAERVTGAIWYPALHHRQQSVKRIQRPSNGFAGLSGYRNRSQVLPKSIDIESIPDGPPVTSASRQCKSQLGRVCTRALSRPLTLLEAVERTRALTKRKNACETAAIGIVGQKTRRGWVGTRTYWRRYHRHLFPISRLASQKFGPACPEKVGLGP
jgi:hypothetical protein